MPGRLVHPRGTAADPRPAVRLRHASVLAALKGHVPLSALEIRPLRAPVTELAVRLRNRPLSPANQNQAATQSLALGPSVLADDLGVAKVGRSVQLRQRERL